MFWPRHMKFAVCDHREDQIEQRSPKRACFFKTFFRGLMSSRFLWLVTANIQAALLSASKCVGKASEAVMFVATVWRKFTEPTDLDPTWIQMVGWIGRINNNQGTILSPIRIPQWISQVWLPGIGGCEWQLGWGEALPTRFQRPSALDALLSAAAMGSNKSPSWQGRKDLLMWVDVHSSSWCDHACSSIRSIIVMFPCFSSRCPGEGRGGAALQVRWGCWIVFRGSPQTGFPNGLGIWLTFSGTIKTSKYGDTKWYKAVTNPQFESAVSTVSLIKLPLSVVKSCKIHYFLYLSPIPSRSAGGKRLRPVLTLLTARATGATEDGFGIIGDFQWVTTPT